MKKNMFFHKLFESLFESCARLHRYLDLSFSYRSFRRGPSRRFSGFRSSLERLDGDAPLPFAKLSKSTVFRPSIEMLEARYALASDIVVGGLLFRGDFTSLGSVYNASSVVDVGFATGSSDFKSLLQLNGSISLDSNKGMFSASGNVNAVASGSTVTLLSGGINNANISSLTSTGLAGLAGGAPVRIVSQRGESPRQKEVWPDEAEGNCVAAMRGGEQPKAKDSSVTQVNSIQFVTLASLSPNGEAQMTPTTSKEE